MWAHNETVFHDFDNCGELVVNFCMEFISIGALRPIGSQ